LRSTVCRASARGLLVGRRRHLMASLLAFSSSASGPPPKPSPSHTAPPPPPASSSARASRFRLLLARAAARRDPEPPPQAESEKKSIAVRTGELFLGLSALFIRAGRGTAPVDEVERREGVLWEQRPEDVEAERQRREVATASPGFSFSAAGLLFPYHLGVAQCLLDKGYIT
uniref:Uncharacterized protein n=1 Tax=Aegilops tauschii subsp. strangulata TaxID=200361 RepID=A0A453CH03_AEGTS